MTTNDETTARDCVAEAAALDAEAAVLERQADDRYDDGPRRYYGLSAVGETVVSQLDAEWRTLVAVLGQIAAGE